MKVEKIQINKLKPAGYNPRQISKKQYNDLKDSIQKFGLVDPIIINKDFTVIGGHQRLKVCKELNYKEIDCVALFLTKEEERELNIRLNKSGGEFDMDILANEFEIEELKDWGFKEIELGLNIDKITDVDIEEISINIKRYSDEDIIQDAYDYFKATGFPYPSLTLMEMKQEINKLANLDLERCQKSTLAYKVADTFHPHRFHSSAIGMRSPVESFDMEKSLIKALKMDLKVGAIKPTNIAFLNLVNGTQACSNFRPAYARMMYDKHAGEDSVVFDSSTGYGGRLVGFLASDCQRYIGVDPNTITHDSNKKMFKVLKNGKKTCKLINLPAEDVNVDKENIRGVADFSFTSPPYFKKEIYSDEKTQSCHRHSEYDDWINNFLKPMMKLNFDVVKAGGRTIINIEDVKVKGELYPLVQPTIDAGKEVGFEYVRTERFVLQHRTSIIDGEKVVKEAFESVIIFNRP